MSPGEREIRYHLNGKAIALELSVERLSQSVARIESDMDEVKRTMTEMRELMESLVKAVAGDDAH